MSRYVPALQEHANGRLYEMTALHDQNGTLVVDLADEAQHLVKLTFDSYLAYRKMDEGDALETLAAISATSSHRKSFYEVFDSDFVDWFVSEGQGVRRREDIRHFVLVAIDDVIDVLALGAPTVSTS